MVMDGAVLVVMALSIFFSMRKGFACALSSFLRGAVGLVLAWFFCDKLATVLNSIEPVHDFIYLRIYDHLAARWEGSDVYLALPSLFTTGANSLAGSLIEEGTSKLTLLILTILSFALIFLGIRLISWVLTHKLSHKERDGFIGFADWLLGLILGTLIGAFNVMLVLALLAPVISIAFPDLTASIPEWFAGSYFAEDIYNNNLLLILFRDLILR